MGISAETDLILATTASDCLVVSEEDDNEGDEEVNEDKIILSEDDDVLVNDGDTVLVNKVTKVLVTNSKRGVSSTVSD